MNTQPTITDIHEMSHCPNCNNRRSSEQLICGCGIPTWEGLWKNEETNSTRVDITEHGLGVFANKDIPARSLIERAPAYVLQIADLDENSTLKRLLHNLPLGCGGEQTTFLGHMVLPWLDGTEHAMLLGNGMLYNHAWDPNCWYWPRQDASSGRYFIDFFTMGSVNAGEELRIYYGKKVWFHPYTENPVERS